MSRIILDDGEGAPVIDLEVVRSEYGQRAKKLACRHSRVTVDERKNLLTCRDCEAEVNPMWWMSRYIIDEWSRFESRRKAAGEAVAMAEKRSRTKCEHCARMTRIRGVW